MSSRTSAPQIFWLFVLAGCNQLFGTVSVELSPTAQFDAPLDAPFACAPIGQTPQFSPYVHQFLTRDCAYYSSTGTTAIAECVVGGARVVVEGPSDGELVPAVGVPSSLLPLEPRLSPDQQTLLARAGGTSNAVVEYTRNGAQWQVSNADVFAVESSAVPYSSIAQTGTALRVIVLDVSTTSLVEYERTNGAWTVVARTPVAQVVPNGVMPDGLSMTSDGLRLVVATGLETRYSDRPSLADPFRASDPLAAPTAMDVFAADDCSRIYLSGLGSIFYAQRL